MLRVPSLTGVASERVAGRVADLPVTSGAVPSLCLERFSPLTVGVASRVPVDRVEAGRV